MIGSGLGGLVGAALLAKAGRSVLVLERNASFGGAAGTFRSGPVVVEASLHELDGLDEDDPKLPVLQELGLTESVEFVEVGDLYEVRSPLLGEPFALPAPPAEAAAALARRFPAHADAFPAYFERMRAIRSATALAARKQDERLWWVLNAPRLPRTFWPLARDLRRSLADVTGRLFGGDPAVELALSANLQYFADDPRRLWFPFYALGQGSYHQGGGHYVKGGSGALVERLVELIRGAGGVAETGRRAVGIAAADGRVTGVEHEAAEGGGRERAEADVVLGNAAPHVLAGLLPEPERATLERRLAGKPVSLTIWTLALALDRRPADFGVRSYSTWLYPGWVRSLRDLRASAELLAAPPGDRSPHLIVADYSGIDSGLPGPPYSVGVGGLDRLESWQGLDAAADRERRERWSERIVADIDREFPGLAGAVVHSVLMTARSNEAYLGTPGGAIYGFAPEPPRRHFFRARTGVGGLFLASAWAGMGGYTGAILGGAAGARAALRERRRPARAAAA